MRAAQTWIDLRESWDLKVDVGEETLTDNNLMEVARKHSPVIRHFKFSRLQEHRESGADWDWWFTSSSNGWIGLRFQAKKLASNGRYSLNSEKGRAQADLLIRSSRAEQLVPMYVFYNAWRASDAPSSWNCETFPRVVELLGCAIAPASVIRPLLIPYRRGLAQTIAGVCLPWSCLVCCERHGIGDLVDRVAGLLRNTWPRDDAEDAVTILDTPSGYVVQALEELGEPFEDPGQPVVYSDVAAPVRHALIAGELPNELLFAS
jgi:hypothetical protein